MLDGVTIAMVSYSRRSPKVANMIRFHRFRFLFFFALIPISTCRARPPWSGA